MNGSSKIHPMRLTLSAVNGGDDERLRAVLARIGGEGPGVSINELHEKSYTLSGSSKSHLESICDRLRGHYQCAINVSPIKAVLLETIRKQSEADGKYIRHTGGLGNYGHCRLRIEPNEAGNGYVFIDDIKGGVVPKEYIKPIDLGIQGAMGRGIIAGFPVVDVKVTLYDGSYHEVDSNEMAFKFAGSIAFKEAARKACPIVMEPVMAVEIEVPEELGAKIRSEVHGHRGRIEHQRIVGGRSEIGAIVPLSELLDSASACLAQFPAAFAGYEAMSDDGSSTDCGSGVNANKPIYPRPRRRSEAAPLGHEDA